MSKGEGRAADTVMLSYDSHKLHEMKDELLAETCFRDLQVVHLVDLLSTIRRVEGVYSLFKSMHLFHDQVVTANWEHSFP